MFFSTNMAHISLVKCVDRGGAVTNRSVYDSTTADEKLRMLSDEECAPLIINWNNDYLSNVSQTLFMPLSTKKALGLFSKKTTAIEWLEKYVNMKILSLHEYALIVVQVLHEKRLVLDFT
jgi:sacsin